MVLIKNLSWEKNSLIHSAMGDNCEEGYGIGIGIGIDQERSESVSESKCEFSWSWNRYQNRPDMDKVSLSESEPKILVSPAPDACSSLGINIVRQVRI